MNFEFATASQILFGPGYFKETARLSVGLGRRALVVYGYNGSAFQDLLKNLESHGLESFAFEVTSEPTVESVQQGISFARENVCDLVIGLGGGSAIDTGKAIASLTNQPGGISDYLEVIGSGKKIIKPGLPMIAVPTTAGTGAEVTRNAVIGSPANRVKVSLRSPYLLPTAAIVDPELTFSLPSDISANTGMDALTQLIEPFVSIAANPLTDAICREGIFRVARSIRKVVLIGQDYEAREDMALASLFGGLALANAKLGAVHGFAGSMGGMLFLPHGAICACLLPIVVDVNIRALKARQLDSTALLKYDEIARILMGSQEASAIDLVAWFSDLCMALHIPKLPRLSVKGNTLINLIEMAAKSSSMRGNPISLTSSEMYEIADKAFD
jgi:alcohol dehydrogenase class IV